MTKVARGFRNNNPGNIKISDIDWHGEALPQERTTDQRGEKVFEVFREMRFGVRAMAINLRRYGKPDRRWDTIKEIIAAWAPKSDNNDEAAYANRVAKSTGFAVDQELDMTDRDTLRALILAMSEVENTLPSGYNPPADWAEQVEAGLDLVFDPTPIKKTKTPKEANAASNRRTAGKIASGIAAALAFGLINETDAAKLTELFSTENLELMAYVGVMLWGGIETLLSNLAKERKT